MRFVAHLPDRRARALCSVALVLATTGARGVPRPTEAPIAALPPSVALARYAFALGLLRKPKALSFEYTVEQLGLRNLEQTHRVYRSGLRERDETLVVDGYTLKRSAVRIFTDRTYRYDVQSVAPTEATYAFAFAGLVRTGDSYGYAFRTEPRALGPFAVSEIVIDGRTFLPAVVRFKIAGAGARGSGVLQYGRSDVYWVIREATVSAHLTNGTTAHERIVWSDYQFHPSLPPSTFHAPRPAASDVPLAPNTIAARNREPGITADFRATRAERSSIQSQVPTTSANG